MDVEDLEAIVVGCGPGPFTGLRVGMATAAAYGHALGLPVHGVCSLDAIGIVAGGNLLVVTDARRREVYWARYRDGVRVEGPAVAAPGRCASAPTKRSGTAAPVSHRSGAGAGGWRLDLGPCTPGAVVSPPSRCQNAGRAGGSMTVVYGN